MIQRMKGIWSLRRQELILIDTLIIIVVNVALWFLSRQNIDSMVLNGTYDIQKVIFLWLCIIILRILFSIYNSIWRYANVKIYLKLVLSDFLGGSIFFLIGRFFAQLSAGFSYTLMAVLLIMMMTLLSRFFYQFTYAYTSQTSDIKLLKRLFNEEEKEFSYHKINVAIVGAGNVGAALAGELIRNPKAHYQPYCFIDKDTDKIGSQMNGIHIYREDDKIIEKIKAMPVQEIIIAIPDASVEEKEKLFNLYRQTDCKVKIYDYPLGGRRASDQGDKRILRDFRIEDLLFRKVLEVKSNQVEEYYRNQTILVTGGGGSIGSELCRQIAKLQPKKLVILDIYENNAYAIQQELIRKYGRYDVVNAKGLNLDVVIASVRDAMRLEEIFNEEKPDIVFHAAAHKHVPLMEHSGCEAIKNNVYGTYNMANLAEKYGVKKFLLISTDKAVNPTNIMGASKRLCEMVIQCRNDSKTEFTAVRFGNVLGSNGSVIPLFKRQIQTGGPITITDKRIIRYFMTIPEAVGLVMETASMAHNGELFVLDMGKPIKILDLAENMIRLSGLKPYKDIKIEEIGLRPGEKLYEELLMKTKELDKTENEMIFIERDQGLSREEVEKKLQILSAAILEDTTANGSKSGHHDAVLAAIEATVPTYHSPEEVNQKASESAEMIRAIGGDREVVEDKDLIFAEVAATSIKVSEK